MNFTNRYCKIDVQGTSSQGYRVKNYKLKFNDKFAHIKSGIPTKTYCMKADYAEGTSTHNTGIANLAHTLYSELIPPQENDLRCRTTIQGFPCVIFHKATVDDEPRFVGKYNFNYDKGSEEAFGFTEDYDVESWEFKVNDEPDCNYLRNILPYYKEIGENNAESGWVKSFERRYPDHDLIDDIWKLSPEDANEEIARFRAMHDWVVSTKDWNLADKDVLKKYREEFQDIFNLHYVLVYYVWTFFFLMVDQRAKNMFMTYWGETGKWYPYLYDNDTCLGINNEGRMKFDYYHEDDDTITDEKGTETKVYNGQDSVLWVKFREAFADEIKQCYQDLRQKGKLTEKVVYDYFVTNQSDRWAASIYNEDSDYKYVAPVRFVDGEWTETDPKTNAHLYQVRGTGEHHLEYFLKGRINYCDSKWEAEAYKNDTITFRINTPTTITSTVKPCADITVTPFSKMYVGIAWNANNTTITKRKIDRGETYTFVAPPDNSFNDTDSYIYGASQISSIGDMAPMYCHHCDISKAVKLIDFKIGSEDPNYQSQLTEITFGSNTLLKHIDLRNCKAITTPPNVSQCMSLEEFYAEGSSITFVQFSRDGGYIKVLHLPQSMTMFKIWNQKFISDFIMEGYSNLTEIIVEKTPNLPIADMLLGSLRSRKLQRVRLIDVEWETTAEDLRTIIDEIESLKIKGFYENGDPYDSPVITGMVKVPSMSNEFLAEVNDKFPELMVCINGVVYCTVTYYNMDGNKLATDTVCQGGNAIDISKDNPPTMADTDEYRYTFSGWDKSLENIQKSTSFVAMYDILYGVTFYRDETKEDKVYGTVYVPHGGLVKDPIVAHAIDIPTKESSAKYHYSFKEWSEDTSYITEPLAVYGIYSEILRDYEISFYNEGVLLETISVYYDSVPEYTSTIPEKMGVIYPQDYKFLGWTPELVAVTGPASYQARFADSDHILDSWQVISSNISNNTYKEKYPIGIMQRINLTNGIIIDAELVDYDKDIAADGSITAMTFITKNFYETYAMESNKAIANSASWRDSSMRTHLQEDVLPIIPSELKNIIIPVTKLTSAGGGNTDPLNMIKTTDEIWTPALIELVNTRGDKDIYAAEGETYQLFDLEDEKAAKAARIRRDLAGDAQRYWTRTPVSAVSNEYWVVAPSGDSWNLFSASSQYGVIFGFCVGKTPSK